MLDDRKKLNACVMDGCLSGKMDAMEKIIFHDKCYNAVSLAGNIRYMYFDFVFNELEF